MDRVAFRIPLPFPPHHFDIAWYGVMIAVGSLFAVLTGVSRAKQSGEKPENILDLALWVLIAGLLGARVFFLISDMDWTGQSTSLFGVIKAFFQFRQGGLVFYGGLLLAIPVGILYLKVRKLAVWKYADIVAPSIPLGIAFARVGCYLNACCFGKPCPLNFPFPVTFPEGSFPEMFYHKANIPLYPTQFISSISALILFVVFSILHRRKKFDGQIFWLFCAAYAVTRFLIEFLRGDNQPVFFKTFTVSQGVGLFLLPTSLLMYFVFRARAKRARATPQ